MNKSKVIEKIVNSNILEEYELKDKCLRSLIKKASRKNMNLGIHSDISVSKPVSAHEMLSIFNRRLKAIPEVDKTERLKKSIENLVDYCTKFPQSTIAIAIFRCATRSYVVYCGLQKGQNTVICVITA